MSKEKQQIEEMARFMCANYDGEKGSCGDGMECDHDCWAYREATHLYTAGYRKQSENTIELPCKVGTTLYFLYNSPYADKPDLTPRIYKTTDWYFKVYKTGIVIKTSDIHGFNKKYDYYLGETVFLTKQEAERVVTDINVGSK